jgi:protein-disulfide isomerase
MRLRLTWTLLLAALVGGAACSKSDPAETKTPATPEPKLPELNVKGVDATALTMRERREWTGQLTDLLAPCADVPVNLVQCLQEQRPCKACAPAAKFLFKQVQAGKPKKEREEAFHARFDASRVKTIVTDGSPEKGAPDAVVTIVEWADFECPHCRLVSPLMDELVQRFPTQVRLVFKFYPLGGHPHGEPAARAAVAAWKQGKFWEMHHALFDHQDKLEAQDIEMYARQLGLDVAKLRADMSAKETLERIEKDKKQAEGLGFEGTPFIFANGRNMPLELLANVEDDLIDWLKTDLELAGQVPKEAPRVAGSTTPAALPVPVTSAAAGKPEGSAAAGKAKKP